MRGIDKLARDATAPLSLDLPLTREPSDDDQAYLFAACGDANCGKSTFLNGLLGSSDLCETSDLPLSHPTRYYRYAATDRDEHSSEYLQLCHRSVEELRDYELLDTSAIHHRADDYPMELVALLTKADLIFCILSVSNPWSPDTWNFLTKLEKEFHPKVALVIQQIDERDPQDIEVVVNHLKDLADKKLDFIPPIFAVSANEALNGNRQSYRQICVYIDQHLGGLEARRQQLRHWVKIADAALIEIDDKVEGRAVELREQDRFIHEVETEIEEMRESFIQKLPDHLIEVGDTFKKEGQWISKHLYRKLGAFRSIVRVFVGDRTASKIEKDFIERIQYAVEQVADRDSTKVILACQKHWQELEMRIEKSMGIELTSDRPIDQNLQSSKDHFISQLRQAAELGINNLRVRHLLENEIRVRNRALKSLTAAWLICTLSGAVCGIMHLPWAPWVLIGLGIGFLSIAILCTWVTRRNILRDFREHILTTCGAFAHTMEGDFENALQVVFRDYTDSLVHVRDHFAREKMSIEPHQRRWQNYFLSLRAIEQDL